MAPDEASYSTVHRLDADRGLPLASVRGWVLLITAIFYVNFVPRIAFGPLMPRI